LMILMDEWCVCGQSNYVQFPGCLNPYCCPEKKPHSRCQSCHLVQAASAGDHSVSRSSIAKASFLGSDNTVTKEGILKDIFSGATRDGRPYEKNTGGITAS
ncbi:hypothetical protein CLAIMM_07535, partial [Cladophialophora immunda]